MNHSMYIPKRLFLGALFAMQLLNSTHAAVDLGLQTPTIGHAFFNPNLPPLPEIQPRSVVDYLIDQDQSSGGGKTLSAVSVNWDTNTQFSLTVSAPPGQKFSVRVPPGRAVGFGGFLWWESTRGGFSPPGSVAVSFTGLEGTPPAFSESDSVLSDSHGFFGFMDLEGTLVTNDFAFTSIRLTATVAPQFTGNGSEDYVPHTESSMQIYYRTPETNDPGRFVFIVPAGTNAPSTNNALPVVNLTRPTNGAVFAVGTPISLTASATDTDGTVSFVDFFAGSLNLGRANGASTNGLYHWVWTNAPLGMFQLRAEAVDNSGGRGISGSVQIAVSGVTNGPPVVSWIRPTNGASFAAGNTILLTAQATDADGAVGYVEFFATPTIQPSITVNLGRVFGAPSNSLYTLPWSNAPAGTFHLQAVAGDNVGARGYSDVVQVAVSGTNAPPTNNVLPAVTWIRPTNGAALPAGPPIIMTARATDLDGTVDFVEFFANSLNLGHGRATTNGFYTFAWSNAPSATIQLHAEAVDNAGGRGVSPSVQIIVGGGTNSPPTNNALPFVTWTQPTNGSVFGAGGPILLIVSATDSNGIIDFVDFFAGSTYLGRGRGTPTNSLYTLTWSNAPAGTFQLHAEAVDNAGARGNSASVQIVVGGSSNPMIDLGVVQASTVGHSFNTTNGLPVPGGQLSSVINYLIDQDQSSGGGGVLPMVSVNWDTYTQFRFTVSAPSGMKFLVAAPPGRGVSFGGFLWWESTRGGFSAPGQVTATFADLEGTAPKFSQSDSVLSDSHGFFGFADLEGTAVTNTFAFTSLTLTGTVAPQYTGNGTENYLPHLESSLRLYYSTAETNDPGRFVSIMPAGPLPGIRVISVSPETGVDLIIYGQAGRTHIVECSEDTVTWTPISSAVMSAASSMPVRDASPTSVNSRFYRVVELP